MIGKVYSSKDFLNNLLINNKKDNNYNNLEKGYISFKNIYFKYPNSSKNVFDNFSLNIKNGINTCIIGRSGSGKTTLLKLLLKIYKIDKGNITINDVNINDIDSNILREKIIYINQNTNLFSSPGWNMMCFSYFTRKYLPTKHICKFLQSILVCHLYCASEFFFSSYTL